MATTITSAGIIFNDASTITSANTFIAKPASPSNGQVLIYNGSTWTGTSLGASPATAKAWVNINGDSAASFQGGVSTVTRAAGSTTATVTCTNPHGLVNENVLYAATGVVPDDYQVTVLNSTQFNITTAASTALNAVSITFTVRTIRSSYNVSSITYLSGLGHFYINFTFPFADIEYVMVGSTGSPSGLNSLDPITADTTVYPIKKSSYPVAAYGQAAFANPPRMALAFFGN